MYAPQWTSRIICAHMHACVAPLEQMPVPGISWSLTAQQRLLVQFQC